MLKHYVTFYYPGTFMSEESTREVATRDAVPTIEPQKHLGWPFAYEFFDREEVTASDGEVLRGPPKNKSGRYYFGQEWSLDELREWVGGNAEYRILISNAEINEWHRLVHTNRGNWQPLFDKDVIVAPEPNGLVSA